MKYIDAGYISVLGILFLYGAHLVCRRRRLTRMVVRAAVSAQEARGADADGALGAPARAGVP